MWGSDVHYTGAASSANYSTWLAGEVMRRHNDPLGGSAGVREPRRPIQPFNSAGAALDLPRSYDDPISPASPPVIFLGLI